MEPVKKEDSKATPPAAKAETKEEMEARIRAEVRAEIAAEENAVKQGKLASGPQYETTERCYVNDRQYENGEKFTFHGTPGHYMKPLNKEAEEKMVKHGVKFGELPLDPLVAMTKV